jgi:hypothetical protein
MLELLRDFFGITEQDPLAEEGLAQLAVHHGALQGRHLRAEGLGVRGHGLLVVAHSLGIRGEVARLITRLEQVLLRLVPDLRAGIVIG